MQTAQTEPHNGRKDRENLLIGDGLRTHWGVASSFVASFQPVNAQALWLATSPSPVETVVERWFNRSVGLMEVGGLNRRIRSRETQPLWDWAAIRMERLEAPGLVPRDASVLTLAVMTIEPRPSPRCGSHGSWSESRASGRV